MNMLPSLVLMLFSFWVLAEEQKFPSLERVEIVKVLSTQDGLKKALVKKEQDRYGWISFTSADKNVFLYRHDTALSADERLPFEQAARASVALVSSGVEFSPHVTEPPVEKVNPLSDSDFQKRKTASIASVDVGLGLSAKKFLASVHQKCFEMKDVVVPSRLFPGSTYLQRDAIVKVESPQPELCLSMPPTWEEAMESGQCQELGSNVAMPQDSFCRKVIGYTQSSFRAYRIGPCSQKDVNSGRCLSKTAEPQVQTNEVWLGDDNKSDCSSFVSAIVASSGRNFRQHQDLSSANQNDNQWATSTMVANFDKPNSCFKPVVLAENTHVILPGDLIINGPPGAHVVMVSEVKNIKDPFGLKANPPRSIEDCDKVPSGWKFKVIEIPAQNSSPREATAGAPYYPFYREACLVELGELRSFKAFGLSVDGIKHYLLRHDASKPGCMNKNSLKPRGLACVAGCQEFRAGP